MTELTHAVLDDATAERIRGIHASFDHLLEVRARAYPDADQSTQWQPMLGWGVRQIIEIASDGLYDAFEYRSVGGAVLFVMGLWTNDGYPEHLHVGDSLWITPKLFIDNVQVLPDPDTS